MVDSNANQDYARYMLRWIESLEWPEFPLAEAELPALRGYWDNGDAADLDGIEARLWAWVDAHGGPAAALDSPRMILARMLICVAQADNQELRERGYFEELLARAGAPSGEVHRRRSAAPRTPWQGDTRSAPAAADTLPRLALLKRQVLLAFCAVSFVSGATVGQSQLEPVWITLMALLIFLWYRLDSDQRGFQRRAGLTAAVILIAAVGIPWYLIESRGWERGRAAILQAIGMFFASIALSSLGALLFSVPPA